MYKCSLTDYTCSKGGAIPAVAGRTRRRGARSRRRARALCLRRERRRPGGRPGVSAVPASRRRWWRFRTRTNRLRASPAGSSGGARRWTRRSWRTRSGCSGRLRPRLPDCRSFDGKWMAVIENYNVFLRSTGSNEPATPLSFDGSEGNYYTLRSIAWSPDSKKLVAYHTRPGYDRQVHYIESSPADQVQPKHFTTTLCPTRRSRHVPQAGRRARYRLSRRCSTSRRKKEIEIDHALFPNPYDITPPVWWKDSRAFTFEYNQRGHQVYRVIEVDAQTGKARPLIDEQSQDVHLLQPSRTGPFRRAAATGTTSTTARRSSGPRSATAGSISISTTAPPAR